MHKHRILNKYTLLAPVLIFLISFVSWDTQNDYLHFVFSFTPDKHYASLDDYFGFILNFENYIHDGFSFLQVLLPIVVSLSAMNFVDEKNGLFSFAYTRVKNYKKFIISSVMKHAAVSSLVMTLGFVVYILIGLLLVGKYIMAPHDYEGHDLFADWLGVGFAHNHPVILYVFDSVLKYILFPFIFSLFTMAVSFYTEKKYLIMSIPTAYYIITTVVLQSLPAITNPNYFNFAWFAPSFSITASVMPEPPSIMIIVSYLPMIAFVVYTMVRSFKEGEKIGIWAFSPCQKAGFFFENESVLLGGLRSSGVCSVVGLYRCAAKGKYELFSRWVY